MPNAGDDPTPGSVPDRAQKSRRDLVHVRPDAEVDHLRPRHRPAKCLLGAALLERAAGGPRKELLRASRWLRGVGFLPASGGPGHP